ncbi:MAG TPA: protocatechuate 3,4-dioxygenase subunit beta, partial [Terrimesophilobacter sp.]|nr:protocatechuate 3,4-dioxygenase subunit beta [Terrimesophilobacter sp.]
MPRRTTTQKNPVPPRDATDQPLQAQISRELTELHNEGARRDLVGERIPTTLRNFPAYRSSVLRHPTKNPKLVDPETIELH